MNLRNALKDGYKSRLKRYTDTVLAVPPEDDPVGRRAIAHFYLGKDETRKRAENVLLRTANWFESCPYIVGGKPRPTRGECDFAAAKLARVLVMGTGEMSAETLAAIKNFYTKNDFESIYKSENHMLIFHISRYIAACHYKNDFFEAYGENGVSLAEKDEAFLADYISFRGKYGWAEFNSFGYNFIDFISLALLYDFAEGKLKNLAQMACDQLLLDMISNTADAMYCGAHGRIYEDQALDHACGGMFLLNGLYFGSAYCDALISDGQLAAVFEEYAEIAELAMSSYFPSDCVFAAAAEKPQVYESYEAKHLHSITYEPPQKQLPQEKGYISKYTYVTPDYAMGSVCFQDDYENSEAAWYAHHQQHEWELTMVHDTRAKIFTHHPGKCGTEGHEHGYWTGDLLCGCGSFFTYKNVTSAIYDIPEDKEPEINANVLFELFDIREDGNYLFLKHENTYGALWFSEGYYRKTDGKYPERELRSKGRKHAVVCVGGATGENGSFEEFIKSVKSKKIEFDKQRMCVSCDNIYLDMQTRRINGKTVEFPYPLAENPFMSAKLGSGVINVTTSLGKTVYDFNTGKITNENTRRGGITEKC